MLHNKKARHHSSAEKIKNLFFVLVLIFVTAIAGVVIYNFYFSSQFSEITNFRELYATEIQLPIISKFAVSDLDKNRFYHLQKSDRLEFNQQVIGAATGDKPVAPIEIELIDPKIGRLILISWQKPKYGDYHLVNIYRSEDADVSPELIADNLAVSGFYQDTSVIDGVTYYYEIRSAYQAEENIVESEYNLAYPIASSDETPPLTPKDVVVQKTNKIGELKIKWKNPPDDDFKAIKIYRTQQPGDIGESDLIAEIKDESAEFIDSDVEGNIVYYYTLTSIDNSDNESTKEILLSTQGNPAPFFQPVNANSNINS